MKTVLLFGTFDILHTGHLNVFKQARKLGDRVVVIVARDVNVKKIKGRAPINSEKERAELLRHITLIDQVIMGAKSNVYALIKKIKPQVIALGYDQNAYVDKLQEKLLEFKLHPKIVRLKPHNVQSKKSSKIKAQLLKSL